MANSTRISNAFITAAIAVSMLGCTKEPAGSDGPPAHSTKPPAALSTAQPTPSATPSATVAAPPVKCPDGSAGEGTLKAPCDATGTARMMEVAWTGKTSDEGPSFRVTNKSDTAILYGRIAVYFYDKAGKQIEVPDTGATPPKNRPNHFCSGRLFGGIMKPGEKAVVTFSCVQKAHIPEGTAAIEGEMQVVGFADSTEKKIEYYWRNNDLTPDARPKGGVKK